MSRLDHGERAGVMTTVPCIRCGSDYEIPDGSPQLAILHAASGNLAVLDRERAVHRCATLTREDESTLLQDAGWILDNPIDPTEGP